MADVSQWLRQKAPARGVNPRNRPQEPPQKGKVAEWFCFSYWQVLCYQLPELGETGVEPNFEVRWKAAGSAFSFWAVFHRSEMSLLPRRPASGLCEVQPAFSQRRLCPPFKHHAVFLWKQALSVFFPRGAIWKSWTFTGKLKYGLVKKRLKFLIYEN